MYGGERGIRTLDTLLTYTPLAGARLQPLGHFSINCYPVFTYYLEVAPGRALLRSFRFLSLRDRPLGVQKVTLFRNDYAALRQRRHNITSVKKSKTVVV